MKKSPVDIFGCLLVSALASALHAQVPVSSTPSKNEAALVIGATETPGVGLQRDGAVNLNSSLALGVEYDRHIIGRHTALYGGVDFVASPFDVKTSFAAADVSPQYAYLFLSPHVRLKLNADGTLQPWLLFGGGYADFSPAQPRSSSGVVSGAGSSGTLEFGGGIDTKPLVRLKRIPVVGQLPIGARFGGRDFYSGQPNYGVRTSSTLQNNIVFTGGLVLHF